MIEPNQNPIITNETKLDIEQIQDAMVKLHDRKADSIFVVMNKKRTTVLKDPGLNRPYSSISPKAAEAVAKQSGGIVVTLSDAIKTLMHLELKKLN